MATIGEILEQALALQAADRAGYLDRACGADPDLRAEVDSLIAAHERAGTSFLNEGCLDGALAPAVEARASGRIGPYLIVDQIGHGGMGEVFSAVRADGQYEKKVALKLVRTGCATAAILERFRGERQILAGLDHPNIARMLDGGTTDGGLPYLVMELVDGVPIDVFCRERSLSIAERLRLFLRVCSAVQFAHQHLVIHRDIKPSNILVTADGAPKLLDFGIAKMLDAVGRAEATMLRPFTPEYASPEQIRSEPISTATDVYSLGVVLYELMTGRSPYRLETRTPDRLAQAITRQEPERPSIAVRRADAGSPAGPTPSPRLQRQLRGDLDVILLKSLRKEPEKRYSSVEQLAEDVRRHLDGLPVAAHKGTWSYHASKFVRRHRASVAAAAVALSTAAAGIAVTVREARIAEANRRRAEARFNDVRALANSLIYEVHDSIQNLPGATGARQLILQRSLEYLESLTRDSGNDPALLRELATAYSRIGTLQGNPMAQNLGDTRAAQASFRKALAMRELLAGSNPGNRRDQVELAAAYLDYSEFELSAAGNVSSGFEYAKRAMAVLEREARVAPRDLQVVTESVRGYTRLGMMQVGEGTMGSVGTTSQGVADLQQALILSHRARQLSPSDAGLRSQEATAEAVLGDALFKLGDRPLALTHFQRALDVFDSLNQQDNVRTAMNAATVNAKMGDVLLVDGKTAEALAHYAESQRAAADQLAGDPRNEFLQTKDVEGSGELGHALLEAGRIEDGLRYVRHALATAQAEPSQTPLVRTMEGFLHGWLGEGLERQGRLREAAREYASGRDLLGAVRAGGANDRRMPIYFCSAIDRLASVLTKLGSLDEAGREYTQALATLEPLSRADADDQELLYALAETYAEEGTLAARYAARGTTAAARLAAWRTARGWFEKSLDIWSRIHNPARISSMGVEVMLPGEVSEALARCHREIRLLGPGSVGPG